MNNLSEQKFQDFLKKESKNLPSKKGRIYSAQQTIRNNSAYEKEEKYNSQLEGKKSIEKEMMELAKTLKRVIISMLENLNEK